jgi:hypothetical protein
MSNGFLIFREKPGGFRRTNLKTDGGMTGSNHPAPAVPAVTF